MRGHTFPPRSADITAFLTDFARRTPDRPALAFPSSVWTFRQLEERVRKAAGGLQALGLAGQRFAVLDKNHPATVELTLAAAQAGSTAVIVNFRLVADEIAYILKDSGARVLFVGAELLPLVEALRAKVPLDRVIVFDAERDGYEPWLAASAPIAAPVTPAPDDPFLILYTSGTTGFPKGSMLTHRSMLAHTRAHLELFGLTEQSVALVPMPLFHVGGISWASSRSMRASSRSSPAIPRRGRCSRRWRSTRSPTPSSCRPSSTASR